MPGGIALVLILFVTVEADLCPEGCKCWFKVSKSFRCPNGSAIHNFKKEFRRFDLSLKEVYLEQLPKLKRFFKTVRYDKVCIYCLHYKVVRLFLDSVCTFESPEKLSCWHRKRPRQFQPEIRVNGDQTWGTCLCEWDWGGTILKLSLRWWNKFFIRWTQ